MDAREVPNFAKLTCINQTHYTNPQPKNTTDKTHNPSSNTINKDRQHLQQQGYSSELGEVSMFCTRIPKSRNIKISNGDIHDNDRKECTIHPKTGKYMEDEE